MVKRVLLCLLTAAILCGGGIELATSGTAEATQSAIKAVHLTLTPQIATGSLPAPQAAITPAAMPPSSTISAEAVQQAMQTVLPSAQTGFEVYDRQTNTVVVSQDADKQFASMSVVKLLIAIDLLGRNNWAIPDTGTQQELHQMLALSDDDIADNLWDENGGPDIVVRAASLMHLTDTQPPEDPDEWGDTKITAQDMVTVYQYITGQLPAPDRDLVLDALSNAPRTTADGTNQYFGIPDGLPNSQWAIKQGWGTSGSQAVMNTTGLVGPNQRYIVVILSSAPESSYSTLNSAVTNGAGTLTSLVNPAAAKAS